MTATPPPVAPPSPHPAAPQKTSGLAVGALILGICGIVPFLGILLGGAGIVLGIVVLARNAGGRGFAIAGIVTGLGGLVIVQALFVPTFLPGLGGARELTSHPPRARCGGNLNSISKAIAMYGVDNEDAFPPDLEVLITEGTVSWTMLRCPSVQSKMPWKQSAEENRRCDYFYLAPSLGAPRDLLVACDYRDNHGEGRNVLYAGTGVKWILEDAFQAELAKPVNAAFAAALRKAERP